ncbi:MAG: AAA family ATPase [Thaumarchaeota archaeon]|nr:AAA family ATPase [Nitrososphaerota archaeon]
MKINFIKINGLYSYGNEKNRIDFGQNTAIVGTNNSGKSAIFKALNYFLKCMTETSSIDMKPWNQQQTHEMTIELTLNDVERQYTAEILAISAKDSSPARLAPDHIVEWLAHRLKRVEITISLADNPYLSDYRRVRYSIYLKDLGVTVCSQGHNSRDIWVCKSIEFTPRSERNTVLLYEVIEDMLKKEPAECEVDTERRVGLDWPAECKISQFPSYTNFVHSKPYNRKRIEFIIDMSGHKILDQECSFFVMMGRMLEQRFAFVSEQRKFQESNDLEMLPLNDDGSNLQGFLFWLQNGDRDKQDACSAIQEMFKNMMKPRNLSFIVSMTKSEESPEHVGLIPPPKGKVYPDRAIVQFVETYGQSQRFTDFMDIGAGVRETLFLLAKCFGRQDGVILLDEPAVNLHPTQIRQLMNQIISTDARFAQIVIVTHSPALASLEMLSSVSEIVRVARQEYSHIMQPFGEDKKWIKKNLPTFHLLKSDIMFAKKVVLVEGNSDKIFLEAILNHCSRHGDDIAVIDVGGVRSFAKFRKFLEIFDIPYGILADEDGKKQFDPKDVLEISLGSIPQAREWTDKKVCLLKKDLEGLLASLEPEMYGEIEKECTKKPERTHEFARRFFAGMSFKDTNNAALLRFIIEWSMKQ